MKKLLLIFILFSSFTTGAAEPRTPVWDLDVRPGEKGLDVLQVYEVGSKTKQPAMKFVAPTASTVFQGFQEIYFSKFNKTLLFTRWAHGAHGETVRIFDPSRRQPLVETFLTTWPMEVTVLDDRLKLTLPMEKFTGDPHPDMAERFWAPLYLKVKERPAGNP